MIRYMRFDIESFIRDSKQWDSEIKDIKAELEAISELKAIEQSPIHSSNISDPTSNTASEYEKLKTKLDRLATYQAAFRYAFNRLSEAQKEVIELFFFQGGMKGQLAYDYGRKWALNTKAVYAERRLALNLMRDIIEERYEL